MNSYYRTPNGDNLLVMSVGRYSATFYWSDGDGCERFEDAASQADTAAGRYEQAAQDATEHAAFERQYAAYLRELAQNLREGKPIVVEVTGDGSA